MSCQCGHAHGRNGCPLCGCMIFERDDGTDGPGKAPKISLECAYQWRQGDPIAAGRTT
jgi:hypothetical protein